jgi:phosphate/sulfate permease
MSAWNKDLSGYIWPWLEPILGVLLVIGGVRTIIRHEFHDHRFDYHGAVAVFAGVLMLLGAILLFRGRAWRKRGWVNWTVFDKVVGAIVGLGILYFIVMRFVSIM